MKKYQRGLHLNWNVNTIDERLIYYNKTGVYY